METYENIEEIIEAEIENGFKGWRINFYEPLGVKYEFPIKPFFGWSWNGTSEDLKKIIITGTKVDGKNKHHLASFRYNGEELFYWRSWTRQVYNIKTQELITLENGQLAQKITNIVNH